MLSKIEFEKFTAFEKLSIPFSPGINVFVGENGTGKTHILKAAYAVCSVTNRHGHLAKEINELFLPSNHQIGRLIKRKKTSVKGKFRVFRQFDETLEVSLGLSFSSHDKYADKIDAVGKKIWFDKQLEAVYIPVKDMLANAPGFRSLFTERKIHFEKIYSDIIDKAFLPILKGQPDNQRKTLLDKLQRAMSGKVAMEGEEFYLRNQQGKLEFTLLAEGYRKLGLLWLLIQNGVLQNGSVLFWDEPETNLNPKMMETLIDILLELQRMGVQIFIATHDYVILKEFDLQQKEGDKIFFHSLFRNDETGEINISTTPDYTQISPNAIDDTFGSILDREIQKSFRKEK
jgi:ABC-type ATPase involved in cell division